MDGWRDGQIDGQIVTSEDVGGGNKGSLACLSDCQIMGGKHVFLFLTTFEFGVERKGRRDKHCILGFPAPFRSP